MTNPMSPSRTGNSRFNNHASTPIDKPVARLTKVLIPRYAWTSRTILVTRGRSCVTTVVVRRRSPSRGPMIARNLNGNTMASPRINAMISSTKAMLPRKPTTLAAVVANWVASQPGSIKSTSRFSVSSIPLQALKPTTQSLNSSTD